MGWGATSAHAQDARLREVEPFRLPMHTDGNSPSFWLDGRLRMFTSVGRPLQINQWDPESLTWSSRDVEVDTLIDLAVWVESAWVDADGAVLGWYHHEPGEMYPDSTLTAPKIGAVFSPDGGESVIDLGIVLESGDPLDPDARNGCFTGGHGDFSVILDREGQFFYFFFTNYGGPSESQGVCVARLAFADRHHPVGRVFKYHDGRWDEPGLGGRVTPLFPVARAWNHANPDSFWGPAVHWNTYLNCFVMLLNRASGKGWTQEGIYATFSTVLSQPESWKQPAKLLGSDDFPDWGTWYPQVMGLDPGCTDTIAGASARFYLSGGSQWEIDFYSVEDLAAEVRAMEWLPESSGTWPSARPPSDARWDPPSP